MKKWEKEHKLAAAGIILALILLSGIVAYGAVSLYQKNAGKNVAGDASGAIETLQGMQEEEAHRSSKESSVNEPGETEVQESDPNGKNDEADASDSENAAPGSNKKRKGSVASKTSTPTPTASPTATPKPTLKPTAVPETSGDSGSGGQEITVSRGEEKGPNGYSFPVYSEITPIDLSQYICTDEAGEKITLPTDGNTEKKHTMLIYLCGSDLIAQIPNDLSGLISSGFDSDDVNVLVLLGGYKDWDENNNKYEYLAESCGNKNAVIYEVHPSVTNYSTRSSNASDPLNENTLKKVADLSTLELGVDGKNMGNPALLAGFMDFAYDHYKAEEYSIILWNHGSGVAGVCVDENVQKDGEGDLLELPELGSAFNSSKLRKDGKKWSFIGMDACLMSSIEVMAVLAQYGNYYIASEEVERGGWDYSGFPKLLKDNDIESIGKKIVDDFYDYKFNYDQVQTMSLVNLNKILELGDEFEAWAGDMMTYANTDPDWYSKFYAARDEVMEFGWNYDLSTFCQIDLIHFLDLLKQKGISSEHMTNLRNLLSVDGTGAIVYQKSTQETERIHGVTIYFENFREIHSAKYEAYYGDMKIFPTYKNFLNKYVYQNDPEVSGEWEDIIQNVEAGNSDTLRVYFNPLKKQYIKKNLGKTKFYFSSAMDMRTTSGALIRNGQYITSQLSYDFASGILEPLVQIWDTDNTKTEYEYEYLINVAQRDDIPIPTSTWEENYRAVDIKTCKKEEEGVYEDKDDAKLIFAKDNPEGTTWSLDKISVYNEDTEAFTEYEKGSEQWNDYLAIADYYKYKVESKYGECYSNMVYNLNSDRTLTENSYSEVWKSRNLMVVAEDLDENKDFFEGGSLEELLGGSTAFSLRRLSAASPTPTVTPTPTTTPSALPAVTPDVGVTPSPTAASSEQPTGTPDAEVTPSATPTSSVTPTSTPTGTPEPTEEPAPTEAPTPVVTSELTSIPEATAAQNAA